MRLSSRATVLVMAIAALTACAGNEKPPRIVGSDPTSAATPISPSEAPAPDGIDLTTLVPPPPGEGWISDSGGPLLVTEENAAEAYGRTAEEAVAQQREERSRGLVDAATEQFTREAPVSLTRTTVRRYTGEVYEYPVAPVALPLEAPPAPAGVTATCTLLPASALDDKTFAGTCSVTWAEQRINAVVALLGTEEAAVRAATVEHTQAFLDTLPT